MVVARQKNQDMIMLDIKKLNMKMLDIKIQPMVKPAPQAISFNWYMLRVTSRTCMHKLELCNPYASFKLRY